MLIPNKFTNLDNCLLSFSTDMIKVLLEQKEIKYIDLYEIMYNKFPQTVDYYFILSLDFLFLLGKLHYENKKDILRLII